MTQADCSVGGGWRGWEWDKWAFENTTELVSACHDACHQCHNWSGGSYVFLTSPTQILVTNFNLKQDGKVLLCDMSSWHGINPRLSRFAYKSVVYSSYCTPQKPTLRLLLGRYTSHKINLYSWAHTCDPSTMEAEKRCSLVQDPFGLYRKTLSWWGWRGRINFT